MAAPADAPLPPDLDIASGYFIQVNAVSPVDGSQVSGVVVSNFSLVVAETLNTAGVTVTPGQFLLVPGPGA